MKNLHRYLEHTLLKADLNYQAVEQLIAEAKAYSFRGLCIPPFWVKKVKRELQDEDIQVVTVVGFPLGNTSTEAKVCETLQAIKDGADELDVVWSLTAFKAGMNWPKIELAKLSTLCHREEKILKVIIETAYLNEEEILQACEICRDAGADFVKTSTGFAPSGAKIEHIKMIRECLPSQVGIKASGGIKTREQAIALIEAGADRIGTSNAIGILTAP
ncbi:deoxyribose-phosphate aldolase [Pleomorphovibrio marinus]|uniref:deoxyribose-phosphate aldolase n=1 Tax=Pleomorphovibrio marinus TaxID=2164132 RepID=UPI000E0AD3E8|nr:deoxyribose-phosphate aldolase [Pleomorphovibrio marinus]